MTASPALGGPGGPSDTAGDLPQTSTTDGSPSAVGLHVEIRCDAGPIRLRGDLDLAAVPLFDEAVTSYRLRHPGRHVVIDTSDLHFIDVSGMRALQRAQSRPDGTADPTVVHVAGPAVRRLRAAMGACR